MLVTARIIEWKSCLLQKKKGLAKAGNMEGTAVYGACGRGRKTKHEPTKGSGDADGGGLAGRLQAFAEELAVAVRRVVWRIFAANLARAITLERGHIAPSGEHSKGGSEWANTSVCSEACHSNHRQATLRKSKALRNSGERKSAKPSSSVNPAPEASTPAKPRPKPKPLRKSTAIDEGLIMTSRRSSEYGLPRAMMRCNITNAAISTGGKVIALARLAAKMLQTTRRTATANSSANAYKQMERVTATWGKEE
ncbi:hypothetical protein FIBSPDRAFT_884188 [Athelia psychrophila]|uniref:Uncharacterized protein n=1 Tax=Athelia psychrophila TaxID=1759441 RepID=A0A166T760_9AGAM|nr:hypothetical protein FIBSPDRAFT_884188 [Fibularhizoctonia sp. CBS 109695]